MHSKTSDHLLRHHRGPHFHDEMVRHFQDRFDPAFWALWDEATAPGAAPTYVDLGTGPGLMLRAWRERFPAASLHAVEIQPYMLETARRIAAETGATLHEADLHTLALPLPDASVDAALCSMVVHEMREPIGMLREVRRLLRPTGHFVLFDWVRVPLREYLERQGDPDLARNPDPAHRADRLEHFMEHNRYALDDLAWLLGETGFRVERTVPWGGGQFAILIAQPA
jgi:ubiquinone/menaquinone biosynthesis C-methylase UbiE